MPEVAQLVGGPTSGRAESRLAEVFVGFIAELLGSEGGLHIPTRTCKRGQGSEHERDLGAYV